MQSEAGSVGMGEEVKPNYFGFHKLNVIGQEKARQIQAIFEAALNRLEDTVGDGQYCREFSIAKTKLEEACFFTKKSMAIIKEHQE